MKRILIADDERTIRDGLEKLILSTKKFTIVAKCKNGKEALDYAKETNPDIVITDIRMPILDGLEFIRLYSAAKIPKFIIISGYEEFEYARKAHTLNVYDYILKPINHTQLLELLDNVSKAIDNDDSNIKFAKEQIGVLTLQNSINSYENIENLALKVNIELKNIIPVIISIKNMYFKSTQEIKSVSQLISSYMQKNYKKTFIDFIYENRIVILFFDETQDFLIDFFNMLIKNASLKISDEIYCSIGKPAKNIKSVNNSYNLALSSLYSSMYINKNIFLPCNEWENIKNPEIYYYKDKNLTAAAIKELDIEKAFDYIQTLIIKTVNDTYPPETLFYYIKEIYNFCYQNTYISKSTFISKLNIDDTIERAKYNSLTLEEYKNLLFKIVSETIDLISCKFEINSSKIIEDVLKYINLNYRHEITLDDISNMFFINKSYFCKIFKERTNTTFNNYLTALRINKSKNLILENKLKIYEVAEMVGFNDSKYFAKIFKEVTGVTPSEYKQHNDIIVL